MRKGGGRETRLETRKGWILVTTTAIDLDLLYIYLFCYTESMSSFVMTAGILGTIMKAKHAIAEVERWRRDVCKAQVTIEIRESRYANFAQ